MASLLSWKVYAHAMIRVCVVLIMLLGSAMAQTPSATPADSKKSQLNPSHCRIAGVVIDETGAVIPGAMIVLSTATGEIRTSSDIDGNFCIESAATPLQIKVSRSAFHPNTITSEIEPVNDWNQLQIKLKAKVEELCCIDWVEPMTIDETSSSVNHVIRLEQIELIPYSRNVTDLF